MIKIIFTKISIIFINYLTDLSITQQLTSSFNNFVKLNFRLIRVLIYLS